MGQEGGQRRDAIANRQAVIDAAAVLLHDRPEASMQEIADYSGLGRTTVYRHFPNRLALLEALMADAIARGNAHVDAFLAGGAGTEQLLREVGEMNVELGLRYRFLYAHQDIAKPALQRLGRRGRDSLSAFLADAQRRGEIRADQTVSWLVTVHVALALAMVGDVLGGRIERPVAGRVLGETMVAMMVPR